MLLRVEFKCLAGQLRKRYRKKNSFCDWVHENHFTLPALSLFWLCPLFLSQLKRETVSVLTETVLKKLVEIEQVSVLSFMIFIIFFLFLWFFFVSETGVKVIIQSCAEQTQTTKMTALAFSFTAYDLDQNKIRNVTTISPESVMNWR